MNEDNIAKLLEGLEPSTPQQGEVMDRTRQHYEEIPDLDDEIVRLAQNQPSKGPYKPL